MCLHGALSSIPFSFICNITTFRKKNSFYLLTPSGVEGVCKDRIGAYMVINVHSI